MGAILEFILDIVSGILTSPTKDKKSSVIFFFFLLAVVGLALAINHFFF